jgi:hypothetical protein
LNQENHLGTEIWRENISGDRQKKQIQRTENEDWTKAETENRSKNDAETNRDSKIQGTTLEEKSMRDQRGLGLCRDPCQRRTTTPEIEFRKEKPATWMNWPEKNRILEQAVHSSEDEQQFARGKER